LTDPLRAVLKKFEDLRNCRVKFPADACCKATKVTGMKSTKGAVNSSSKMGGDKTIFADEAKSTGTGIIQWTETACLQVVDAVIRVEKEILRNRIPLLAGKRMRKWDWVDSLLPPELQSRKGNHRLGHRSSPRWRGCFMQLQQRYRANLRKDGGKSYQRPALSKELFSLMKQHEDLLSSKADMNRVDDSSKLNNSEEEAAMSAFTYTSTKVADQLSRKTPKISSFQAVSKEVTILMSGRYSDRLCAQSGAQTHVRSGSLCLSVSPPFDHSQGCSPFQKAPSPQRDFGGNI
jgi:hypothetical protein